MFSKHRRTSYLHEWTDRCISFEILFLYTKLCTKVPPKLSLVLPYAMHWVGLQAPQLQSNGTCWHAEVSLEVEFSVRGVQPVSQPWEVQPVPSYHKSTAICLQIYTQCHLVWGSHCHCSHVPGLCGLGVTHIGSSFPHLEVAEMLQINRWTTNWHPMSPFFLLQVDTPAHTLLIIQCTQTHNAYIHQYLTLDFN